MKAIKRHCNVITYEAATKRAKCRICGKHIADGESVYAYTLSESGNATRYEHIECTCERENAIESESNEVRGNQAQHGLMFEFRIVLSEKYDTPKVAQEFTSHGFERTAYGYHSELIGDLRNNQCLVTFLESLTRSGKYFNIGVTVHGLFTNETVKWFKERRFLEAIDGFSVEYEADTVTYRTKAYCFTDIRKAYITARNFSVCFQTKVNQWGLSEKTATAILNRWFDKMTIKTQKDLAKAKSYKA